MVLETTRRKRGKELLRLQHCKGTELSQSCNVLFPAGSEQCKSLAECAESAFSKSLSVSPAGSVGASAAHSRQRSPPATRTPRRAQNLLAGCIFDGLACQKCFCVTLDKSNRTEDEQVYEIGGVYNAKNDKCNGR